jgi:hypothetical protein
MLKTLAFIAPISVFSAWDNPKLGIGTIILSSVLAKITDTPFQSKRHDIVEASLVSGLRITTTQNRIIRVLLGLFHAVATVQIAFRGQRELEKNRQKSKGKLTASNMFYQVFNMIGILSLSITSAIWLSTGYYGQ